MRIAGARQTVRRRLVITGMVLLIGLLAPSAHADRIGSIGPIDPRDLPVTIHLCDEGDACVGICLGFDAKKIDIDIDEGIIVYIGTEKGGPYAGWSPEC